MSAAQPGPDPDADVSPIRVVETTVAAHEWDDWRASAAAASQRAHRIAVVTAVLVAAAVAISGLLLLPSAARISIVLYAPIVGLLIWFLARHVLTRLGLASLANQARRIVVPALLEDIDTAALITLLRHGGTMVPERCTTIFVDRRDSLVALIAAEYDMSAFPAASFPVDGFGP